MQEQLFEVGGSGRTSSAWWASSAGKAWRKEYDRNRAVSGANRLRMRERSAKKLGLTFEEYEQQAAERLVKRKWPACRVWFPICVECGATFTSPRYRRTTCSEDCRRSAFSAYMLARYHADPDNWSTKRKRRRLFERDGWRCRVCGTKVADNLPRDHPRRAVAMHIVAKATGGEWTDENMATGCHRCNVADGVNKLPIQFAIAV
jgi:hypothetical protein